MLRPDFCLFSLVWVFFRFCFVSVCLLMITPVQQSGTVSNEDDCIFLIVLVLRNRICAVKKEKKKKKVSTTFW